MPLFFICVKYEVQGNVDYHCIALIVRWWSIWLKRLKAEETSR